MVGNEFTLCMNHKVASVEIAWKVWRALMITLNKKSIGKIKAMGNIYMHDCHSEESLVNKFLRKGITDQYRFLVITIS